MIEPKKLTQTNTPLPNLLEGLLLDYLISISVGGEAQLKQKEYTKLKLEAAKNTSRLLEGNKPITKKEQDELANKKSESLDTILKKVVNLPTTESPSSSSGGASQENNANEGLKQFLVAMAAGRRENELIFGKKESDSSQVDNSWGIEASKTIGCYRKNIHSTRTREKDGWAEFAISYDNKIFLNNTQKKTIGGVFI